MKLYGYELYKITKNRTFWGIVLALLALSLFVFHIQQKEFDDQKDIRDLYTELAEKASSLLPEEAERELELKYVEYEIRETMATMTADMTAPLILSSLEEEYPELYAEITAQKETVSFAELHRYHTAYYELYEDTKYVAGFQGYLDSVQKNAEQMARSPIYAGNGFALRNFQKTREAFNKLRDLSLSFGMQHGLIAVTDYSLGDVLLVLLVFVTTLFIFAEEQSNGMMALIRTQKRGRLQLVLAKVFSLLTVTTALGTVYQLILYAWGEYLYGFGNLSRAIQSMRGFRNSGTALTVRQFLLSAGGVKIATLLAIGAFFATMFILFQGKAAMICLVSLIPIGVAWVLYSAVPSNALFNHPRYINPFAFMNGYSLFGEYVNLNIFGQPVNLRTLVIPMCAGALLMGVVLCVVLFVQLREERKVWAVALLWEKISRLWRKSDKAACLFAEEGFKLMIQGRILLMLLIVSTIAIVSTTGVRKVTFDVDELVYRKYIRSVCGEVTSEKMESLRKKQEQFEAIPQAIDNYKRLYEEERISAQEMQAGISNIEMTLGLQQKGFSAALEDAEYAEQTGSWIVDQLTANAWFGDPRTDLTDGLILMCTVVLCLSPVFTMDAKNGVDHIMRSTRNGRRSLTAVKLVWSALILLVLYVCIYTPRIVCLLKDYGALQWNAPVGSVRLFSENKLDGTILSFYFRLHAMRFLLLLSAGLTASFIASRIGRQMIVIVISAILFVLPVILQLQGVELRYLSYNNLFLLTDSLKTNLGMRKSILHLSIAVIIGVLTVWALFYGCRTGRRRDRNWN